MHVDEPKTVLIGDVESGRNAASNDNQEDTPAGVSRGSHAKHATTAPPKQARDFKFKTGATSNAAGTKSDDDPSASQRSSRKKRSVWAAFSLLLVIAAIAIGVGTSRRSKSTASSDTVHALGEDDLGEGIDAEAKEIDMKEMSSGTSSTVPAPPNQGDESTGDVAATQSVESISGASDQGDTHPISTTNSNNVLQLCPPGLPAGICAAEKLSDAASLAACADECMEAQCCQAEEGQESCMSTCSKECFSYVDCLNLSGTEATSGGDPSSGSSAALSDSLQGGDTLSVDYYEGYNLNFLISKGDAEKLMPYSHFAPLRLAHGTHVTESANKTSSDSSGGYYISLYAAKIVADIAGEEFKVGRADIFTYTVDPLGKQSLLVVGAYMEVPKMLQGSQELIDIYERMVSDLALDSR